MRATAPLALLALLTSCKITAPAAADQAPDPTEAPTPTPTPTPTSTPTPTPTPVPAGDWLSSPTLLGAASIASEFDPMSALIPANAAPIEPDNEPQGAFRFLCGAGQISYDDPLVFPGQPGKSHLHQYYGNLKADAYSTYDTLRKSGGSTCNMYGAGTQAANRSAYWMPALLDGKGHVIQPDELIIYYKRWPKNNALCTERGKACVPLPNGLAFIAGRNMLDLSQPPTGNFHFMCDGVTAATPSMDEALAHCTAGHQFGVVGDAPMCWDGTHLDSPDHRSHLVFQVDTHLGYYACPDDHPYRTPVLTFNARYSVQSGDDTSLWTFSSDAMAPGQPRGSTFHIDYIMAWDDTVRDMFEDNCLDKRLNCNSGNLGNGYALKGAAMPIYSGVAMETNPNRLVPVPPMPAM
jgi:Domain of unknown function (DUF1996)